MLHFAASLPKVHLTKPNRAIRVKIDFAGESTLRLSGMTWDHARGYDPLVAADAAAQVDPGVSVAWDRRSLQDFEHFPLEELARKYDLIVMDHPHVGDAIASDAVVPLERLLPPERLAVLRADCLPVVWNSYVAEGLTWALPIDAATQVLIWRPGRLERAPASWDEVSRTSPGKGARCCRYGRRTR